MHCFYVFLNDICCQYKNNGKAYASIIIIIAFIWCSSLPSAFRHQIFLLKYPEKCVKALWIINKDREMKIVIINLECQHLNDQLLTCNTKYWVLNTLLNIKYSLLCIFNPRIFVQSLLVYTALWFYWRAVYVIMQIIPCGCTQFEEKAARLLDSVRVSPVVGRK